MVGVFSIADAAVVGSFLTLVGVLVSARWAYRAAKETRPNGGSSMRDDILDIKADLRDIKAVQRAQEVRIHDLEFPAHVRITPSLTED